MVTSRTQETRQGFAHLRAADPVLAALIDERPNYDPDAWREELPVMDLFGCLVFQIIGQQLSVKATRAILGRLSNQFGGRLPSPQEVAELGEESLRELGLSGRKAKTVIDLVEHFADGRLSEARLSVLSDEQILSELTQLKGIGPWTVHGALLISLHRANVVPTGDLMLRKEVKKRYNLDHLPTEAEVGKIARVWQPYGSLSVTLLFAAVKPS